MGDERGGGAGGGEGGADWEPLVPVDTPVFLAELLTAQADKHARRRCTCAREHGGTGRYVFYSPDGGHYRRSNFARRVFRPATGDTSQ